MRQHKIKSRIQDIGHTRIIEEREIESSTNQGKYASCYSSATGSYYRFVQRDTYRRIGYHRSNSRSRIIYSMVKEDQMQICLNYEVGWYKINSSFQRVRLFKFTITLKLGTVLNPILYICKCTNILLSLCKSIKQGEAVLTFLIKFFLELFIR